MHVIVIEANSGGQFSTDLGNLSDPVGKKVQYSAGAFTKHAEITHVVTDPISVRSIAIAFHRGTVAKR